MSSIKYLTVGVGILNAKLHLKIKECDSKTNIYSSESLVVPLKLRGAVYSGDNVQLGHLCKWTILHLFQIVM